MAMTADEILVRLIAQTQQYQASMGQARGATSAVDTQLKVLRETLSKPLPTPKGGGLGDLGAQAADANKQIRNLQFNLPNLAAQINDIGVTAAGGMQPWLIALQQGTQLNQAFAGQSSRNILAQMGGALRSVLSVQSLVVLGLVGGAAAAIQWGMSLLKSADDTDKAKKELEQFDKALDRANTALDEMKRLAEDLSSAGLTKIGEKYGEVTAAVLAMVEAQERLARVDATRAVSDSISEIDTKIGSSFGQWVRRMQSSVELPEEFLRTREIIERLQTDLRLTENDAKTLGQAFREAFSAKTPEEQLAALERVRTYLLLIADSGREGAKEAEGLLRPVVSAEDAVRRLLALTNNLPAAFTAAANAAKAITDELAAAARTMDRLRSAGIADERRSQIELDYRKDPVARAKALEAAKWDEAGHPAGDQWVFNRLRQEAIERAGRIAANNAERERLNDIDRENERKSRRGAGAAAKAVAGLDDSILKEIEAMRAEADVLNRLELSMDTYGNAVEAARKEAEMLQQLQNKGVPVTEALRQQVRGLAADWLAAADAQEEARSRHEEFQSRMTEMRTTMESAFTGWITGAHSFRDALSGVIAKLAEMAASRAFELLWDGPKSGSAGGVLGSIFSGLFGGKRELGGPVQAGRAYVVGERRPELFVPSTNGTIVPNVPPPFQATRGGAASGGAVDVRVYVDEGGNWQAAVEAISGSVSRAEVDRRAPSIVGQSVRQVGVASRKTKSYLGV